MSQEQFKSLIDMQERCCAQYASNPLFGTKQNGVYQWLTYGEFGVQVDRFRGALAKLGVSRGDKVAIISNNRVEWAVAAYATYGLGAHFVPMYEAQLPKDWKYILNDSGAKVLLVSTPAIYEDVSSFPEVLDNLEHIICIDAKSSEPHSWGHHISEGQNNPVESVELGWDEPAGLIYTSGTTGNPKGVILSHGNICSNINAVHSALPFRNGDRSCSFLPWAHVFGQTCELHVMISIGASVGLAESVKTLTDDFLLVKPTILFSVPRIFNRIYDGIQKTMGSAPPVKKMLMKRAFAVAKKRRVMRERGQHSARVEWEFALLDRLVFSKVRERFGGQLRYAISGGAALSATVGEFIDDLGITVFEGYGLTETSPIAACNRPGVRRIGTIGMPIEDVEIFICDEEGNVLPTNTDGEICVVGPNVMQGYHNLPEKTAEVMFELDGKRAFKTGDMGRILDDGFIKVTGRFKEQYKLENGKYVVPTPLEDSLKLSSLINQAFLWGDNRLYNVCLVVPDFEVLNKWALENGIEDASPEALAKNPRVHAAIGEELEKQATHFKGYERPRKWAILTEEFSPENGLMTPKMSVKRRLVVDRYRSTLEGMYKD